MSTRMLIDARHPEETRVAVLKGNRIEEFDFDSADHKQIKGNIYLAKVTRVEPSLQAAFVDFGGNRHGFLAFSEIHPDYYQIPKEDREALLAEEAAHAAEEAALRAAEEAEEDAYDAGDGAYADDDLGGVTEIDTSEKDDVATIEGGHVETPFSEDEEPAEAEYDAGEEGAEDGAEDGARRGRGRGRRRQGRSQGKDTRDQADDLRQRRMALRRRYKIQDVIQRRQVLLVQVVKEERGNKGAALTTYLSLAGRYCVLMPNSSHGGGISRKISSVADRKRLKSIIAEMQLPKSMGCIVRTAGLQRTKPEIKRDFDYLARLWDEIRENTLKSSAPALIHSDSDLIKRAIRDIYNRDIEEVVVEGDEGYRAARDFMKLLMPSHARRVKQYADPVPLFQRYGAEDQLTAMYDPVVQLKSGGYIVINPTEALVSIDINSGRSTKEHGIEATALNTNLEAAREIARQLRLRDMAGLVVIDFIDMEYGSNIRKVEKAMKDALKNDRARIQVGRISGFGLMEMSRQRLRTGVLEATTRECPHCDGSGLVRTAGSAGLAALRLIEDEAAKGKGTVITLFASQEASIYVLNSKRADLAEIEHRYGVTVEVLPEGENEGAKMRVASSGPRNEFVPRFEQIAVIEEEDDYVEEDEADDEIVESRESSRGRDRDEGDGEGRRKRRKRRRGRNRDRQDEADGESAETEGEDVESEADEAGEGSDAETDANGEDGEGPRKRRRRGRRRRGGRNRDEAGSEGAHEGEGEGEGEADAADEAAVAAEPVAEATPAGADEAPAKPKRSRRKKADAEAEATAVEAPVAEEAPAAEEAAAAAEPAAKPKRTRRKKADAEAEATAVEAPVAEEAPAVEAAPAAEEPAAKPKRARRKKADAEPAETVTTEAPEAAPAEVEPEAEAAESDEASAKRRTGWWQRTFGN
ncbi:MAG: ribonuclease E/G [Sphingomonadales bacterium]|nr:ribonuclease E/G [Sphingomonadales bacterium]